MKKSHFRIGVNFKKEMTHQYNFLATAVAMGMRDEHLCFSMVGTCFITTANRNLKRDDLTSMQNPPVYQNFLGLSKDHSTSKFHEDHFQGGFLPALLLPPYLLVAPRHGKRSEVELVETEGAGRPGGYEATWADPAAAEEYECPICKQVRFWQKCH